MKAYIFIFSLTWNTCKMTQHYFIKRSTWLSYFFLQTARCKANFTRQNGGQIVFLIHFSFLFKSVKTLCIQQNKTPLLLIVNIACYCKSGYSHLWPSTEYVFSMVKQYAWVQYQYKIRVIYHINLKILVVYHRCGSILRGFKLTV